MYFAPEIETFIGNELGIALGDSDQAILTAKSANYGGQFAGLLTRSAATTGMQPEQMRSAAGLLVALVPVSQVLLQRKPRSLPTSRIHSRTWPSRSSSE